MQGIRPETLTTRELLRYADLMNNDGLPRDWAAELIKRLEAQTEHKPND